MREGNGYEITLRAREGTTIDPRQAILRPVPLGRNVGRWEDRPVWTDGSGAGLALGRWWLYPESRVVIPASGETTLLLDRLPPELLGAQGIRLSVPGSPFRLGVRLLTPTSAPVPPRLAPGTRFLGALNPDHRGVVDAKNEWLPMGRRVFRRLALVAPTEHGWTADLESGERVEILFNPLSTPGLIPLLPEPGAWRYVGREFWAYPNTVEALSDSGRVRGTALLDRRKIRVISLSRLWATGSVMLSGPLSGFGDPVGAMGSWAVLHPLVAIVEPVDPAPVRISLPRAAVGDVPISGEEAIDFVRQGAGRRYFLIAADFWHLDRQLSAIAPGAASPEIRRAMAMARPSPGMTPAQVAWAIGWPNDPMPREALERFRDGTWEYPAASGWNAARFTDGHLTSYGPGLR